ncbi:MAG TPA: lycopene cyclase domain-containing protein [Anaerolineales bacterium]|nr:lycopene cyclase domain-containing protein [Anaerolineales bacterium]
MTYFGILILFILPPLALLSIAVPRDLWIWLRRGERQVDWQSYTILLAHVVLALVYTSPWDNYLVATGVWWYNPDLVTGVKLGWVPIEEYTFFVMQTLLTGLWALLLHRKYKSKTIPLKPLPGLRVSASLLSILVGGAALLALLSGWQPGTYLCLILAWALVPVFVQMAFGGDILFARGGRLALTILPPTLYLWAVDAFAIQSGTWTIDPGQTTGFKLGVLPIEEMLFFFMTNLIIGFGVHLMLAEESQLRAQGWLRRLKTKRKFTVHIPGHQNPSAGSAESQPGGRWD